MGIENPTTLVTCPDCQGIRHAPFAPAHVVGGQFAGNLVNCPTCNDKGVIDAYRAARLEAADAWRNWRIDNGWSLRDLAAHIGVTPHEFSDFENRRADAALHEKVERLLKETFKAVVTHGLDLIKVGSGQEPADSPNPKPEIDKKRTKEQILAELGRVQTLIGRARAANWDENSPDKEHKVIDLLDEAFDIIVTLRSED